MHCRVTPSTLSQAVGPGLHLESSSHTEYAAAGQALSTQKYASPGPGRRATNHMASFQFLSLSLSLPLSLSLSLPPSPGPCKGSREPRQGWLVEPRKGCGLGPPGPCKGSREPRQGWLVEPRKGCGLGPWKGSKENPERGVWYARKPRKGWYKLSRSLSLSFFRQGYPLSLSVPTAESVGLAAVCVCVCVCHKLRLQSHSCSRRTLEVLLQNQKYHS